MKNSVFVFLIVLVLGGTSCQKDVMTAEPQRESISFSPLALANSKAASISNTTLNSYKVSARAQNLAYSAFNFDASYTKAEDGSWSTTAGVHYWPGDETAVLAFTAYAPTNFANSMGVAPVIGENAVTINNLQPKRQASEQVDLLVARVTQSRSQGLEVPLKFKHAFSQIIIQAQCDNPDMYTVEVIGVKLGNIVKQANLTIPNTAADGQLSGAWSGHVEDKITYVSGGVSKSPITLTASPQNIMMGGGSFMIIPQWGHTAGWDGSASDTNPYIAVLCRIKQSNGNGGKVLLYPTSADKFAYAAVGVNTQWAPGRTYTYTIKFFSNGGGAGKVPPERADPTKPDSNKVDMNPQAGDNVVGGPLSFTVSTTAWGDEPSTANPVQ